jgi:prolipoprotein diacylglyceryltransferase
VECGSRSYRFIQEAAASMGTATVCLAAAVNRRQLCVQNRRWAHFALRRFAWCVNCVSMRWTGNLRVHFFFEVAGYVAAALTYIVTRSRRGDRLPDIHRSTVLAGAAFGAAVGSRLLFVLCDPSRFADPASWFAGKTVVGGLLGGLLAVELAKRYSGITRSTGDLFVDPLIMAMCIGRVGCFLAGPIDKTAGSPTSLPWGIAAGDGVVRHPVALYEIAFLLLLGLGLRRVSRDGDRFRIFLASYLAFRFAVDFLKPEPAAILFGLSAIQWACVAGVLYYVAVLTDDHRDPALSFLRRRRVDLHDVLPQD